MLRKSEHLFRFVSTENMLVTEQDLVIRTYQDLCLRGKCGVSYTQIVIVDQHLFYRM